MSKQLAPHEARLIAALLERAGDTFSNHGCSDFDVAAEAGLTLAQANELWLQLAAWDDPEFAESAGRIHFDWVLMHYFADKLRKDCDVG